LLHRHVAVVVVGIGGAGGALLHGGNALGGAVSLYDIWQSQTSLGIGFQPYCQKLDPAVKNTTILPAEKSQILEKCEPLLGTAKAEEPVQGIQTPTDCR
jgi:hypothetical protein